MGWANLSKVMRAFPKRALALLGGLVLGTPLVFVPPFGRAEDVSPSMARPRTLASRIQYRPVIDRSELLQATQQTLHYVSALRGLPVLSPVKAALQSREEIERSLIRDLDERTTADEFDAETKLFLKLGLVPKDFRYRELLVGIINEQVAGYYRPRTKSLYLADWLTLEEQNTVMVHELAHALQDQHFHLERFARPPKGWSDRELAILSLIEGDATAVMLNHLLKPQRLDITSIPLPLSTVFDQLQKSDDQRIKVLNSAPPIIRESLLFPYAYGTTFVQYILIHSSWKRVSDAYADPPNSTEQILHPAKFLDRDDPLRIELPRLEKILGRAMLRRLSDTMGEFGYYLILSPYVDKTKARRAAEGWDGDQLALYENRRTGQLLLVHYTTWDSEAEAEEFARVYAERTTARYPDAREVQGTETPTVHRWDTGEGIVYLERRGADVLILEGLAQADAQKLAPLTKALWQTRKMETGSARRPSSR